MSNFNNVFISYGRAESKAFATKLHDDLCERGYNVWFDQNDIPLGVDFQHQIDEGIEKADTFIFIIAPHAVKSVYCRKEIDLAVKRGKRIVPILQIEPTTKEVWDKLHPAIGKINWVYMRQEWQKDIPQENYKQLDDYEPAFEGLWSLLESHKEYVRTHTEILAKALNWESHNKDSHLLLVGKERQEAEKWLLKEFATEQSPCLPSDLHTDFLCESRKNAENLLTDCFISYSSQDKEEREAVRLALARHLITTWTHNRDIVKGEEFDKAIERGIEGADNFLFFITKDSIISEYCLFELEYAKKLNKRIIPLLIEEVSAKEFPTQIKNLQYINFTDNVITEVTSKNEKTDFEKDIDTLVEEINRNREHYKKHKVFLTNALKWERQNNNASVLLRGHKLDEAKVWLKRGQKLSKHQPLPLHENFILESEAKSGNLETEIFVSYSRTDSDFARKLNEELQFNGKTTWFDQESIASGADFQQEIYRGIEGATNFLFVISPDAIESPYCADEVEYAQKLGKRFITVLHRETDPSTLPPALASVQWIDFVGKDFNKQFGEVIRTLDTDREYVRMHNVWQKEALQWQQSNKNKDYLLRGSSFALANEWLESADKEKKQPQPTDLQREYLDESQAAIFALERKEKNTIKRLRGLLAVAVVALIAFLGISFYVYYLYNTSNRLRVYAEKLNDRANLNRIKAEEEAERAKEALKVADAAKQETSKALVQLQEKEKNLQKALSDAINSKKFAEAKRIEAKLAQNQAEQEKEKAVISQQLADTESKSNEKISTALQLTEKDPTYALFLAKEAYQENPKPITKDVVFSIHRNHSFYETKYKGHTASINEIAISPNGTILTGSSDRTAHLINSSGKRISIAGGADRVGSADSGFSSDGELTRSIAGHKGYIGTVAFSSDGELIALGGENKITVWTKEGEFVTTLQNDDETSMSKVVFMPDNKHLITGDYNSYIRKWNIETQEVVAENDLSEEEITDIQITSDGKKIIVSTIESANILDTNLEIQDYFFSDMEHVEAIDISPNDSLLVTGSWGKRRIILWKLSNTSEPIFIAPTDYVKSISFSPDGNYILAGLLNGNVQKWNLTGNLVHTFKGHQDRVSGIGFIDDKMVTSSHDATVLVWQNEGSLLQEKKIHEKIITAISQNKISNNLLTSSYDKYWKLHNENGELIREKQYDSEVMSSIFSKDGTKAVIGLWKKEVELWNGDLTQKEATITLSHYVKRVAISDDNKYIAIGINNDRGRYKGEVLIYDISDMATPILKISTPAEVSAITFYPELSDYVGVADEKGTLQIWQLSNKSMYSNFSSLYPHHIYLLKFSKENERILVGGRNDNAILSDWSGKVKANLQGHTSFVLGGGFSTNQNQIITSSTDRSIKIWDLEGNLIKTLTGHQDNVRGAIFSNDNNKIYSVDESGNMKIWNAVISPLENNDLYSPDTPDLLSVGVEPSKEDLEQATLNEILGLIDQYNEKLDEAGYEVEKYPITLKIIELFEVAVTKNGFSEDDQFDYEVAYSEAINNGLYIDKKGEILQIAKTGIEKGFTEELFTQGAFAAFLVNNQFEEAEKIYQKYYKTSDWLDMLEMDIGILSISEVITEEQEAFFEKLMKESGKKVEKKRKSRKPKQ
ncbi:TIR domain-containing protein [Bernardetia sp. ABR2-2B]|uniref:TIR domain-containing protein n=1 Tax=Bernardetia sp. ABR2-2B TaxID=3127472 RepID=UPI0030CCF36A